MNDEERKKQRIDNYIFTATNDALLVKRCVIKKITMKNSFVVK